MYEAVRKRRDQQVHGSCIQVLPSSLIAKKKTSKSIVRQQILLQSAQSYLMMSVCSVTSRPNPRIQMF